MKRRLLASVVALVAIAVVLSAHDPSKHKGKPVEGQVTAVGSDRFEMKTATGAVTVTFSAKTKFEHGKEAVTKDHVKTGERVAVFGTKLPSGEIAAREVLLGTGDSSSAVKGQAKKSSGAHKH